MNTVDPLANIAMRCHRILLTGAAGKLGKVLRDRLGRYADIVRLSDISDLGPARENEEIQICNLSSPFSVDSLVQNVDVILHFGGVSVERPFEEVLESNIRGVYYLYEAARRHGIKRIIFASSNHVTGFYRQGEVIDANVPLRPDSFYGLSKAYGENLARLYFDRYGIETVCLRIGSCYPQPLDKRMMKTWLGYDDFEQLICRSMFAHKVGYTVVYGVSDNKNGWWDNRHAAHLAFCPTQSSNEFEDSFVFMSDIPPDDPAAQFQGGSFVKTLM